MVRLIPKDEKFQELFVEGARIVLEAARKLEEMIGVYDRLDERVVRDPGAWSTKATRSTTRSRRGSTGRSSRRSIARTSTTSCRASTTSLDGIQEIAETFVIYDVKQPTDDARRLAGILAAQALQLGEAIGKLESLKGIEPHVRQIHELENEADGLSRAAVARLFRDGIEAIEVIKWRDVYTALENTIDAAEDAAEVIERIVAKNA